MTELDLSDITVDDKLNPRAKGLDTPTVDEYTAAVKAGVELPDVVVYHDGSARWLSEGFHRYAAHGKAGRSKIKAEVRTGDRRAALLNALASNQTHGLKRSNDDKRLAVRLALENVPEWVDERIAAHCGVTHPFVQDVRSAVAAETVTVTVSGDEERTTVGVSGQGKRGPKKKKPDHARAAARLLLKDHTRPDEDVAKEVGCAARTVKIARKALQDKGRIPKAETRPVAKPATVRTFKDVLGVAIPPLHRDTFFDPELETTIAALVNLHGEADRLYQSLVRSLSHKPYKFCHFGKASEALAQLAKPKGLVVQAVEHLRAGVPYCVCPECGGADAGCKTCRFSGYLPKWRHDELKGGAA